MSVANMRAGLLCTKRDYENAFAEVRLGVAALDMNTVAIYAKRDAINAVYLYTESLKIGRDQLLRILNVVSPGFNNPFVVLQPQDGPSRTLTKPEIVAEFDNTVNTRSPADAAQTFHSQYLYHAWCLFCGETSNSQWLSLSPKFGLKPFATMFDLTQTRTAEVLHQFYRTRHKPPLDERLAGLCKSCHKPCITCGKRMALVPPVLEELRSYAQEQACYSCVSGSIVTLPLPKPNQKELRIYQMKLTSLGRR